MRRSLNIFLIGITLLITGGVGSGVCAQPSDAPEVSAQAEQRLADLAERYTGVKTGAAGAVVENASAALESDIEETPLGFASGAESGQATAAVPTGGWLLSTLAALGVVIGSIFAVRWAYAKMGGRVVARSSPAVEVLSRTTVAPKNQVLLLRVGQRVLVVGDSSTGLRTLANLDDPEEVASLLQSVTAVADTSVTKSFNSLVARFNGEYDGKEQLDQEGGDSGEVHVDRTRDSLSGLASRLRTLGGKGDAA